MKFYITFGFDSYLRNKYMVIEAKSELQARIIARDTFSRNWAGLYYEDEGKEIVKKYNLKQILLSEY